MRSFIAAAILLFAAAFQLPAQNDVLRLSLEEAQKMAIERNRTLENATIDVKIAQANRWQAIASMLPQVNASGTYNDMFGYLMNFGGMSIALPSSASMGVTASMALSGAQVLNAAISKISQQMSDITAHQTEQNVASQVKTLYYSILMADQTIALLHDNLDGVQRLYDFSQQSVDVGASEQVSADQLMVQVASAKTAIKNSENSLEMLYNSLRLQLDLDPDAEIVLTDTIDKLLDMDAGLAMMNEQFNLDNNYNYQLLKKNVELARKQITLNKWSLAPTVSLAYQFSAKHNFGEGMDMTPPNTMNVMVSVPIFSSLSNTKKIQSAKMSYQKQLNTLAETENSLQIQYRQLCYNLQNAHAKYIDQKQAVEVNKRVFDNISRKYEQGYSSALEMTNASTTLITSQSAYVQAVLEFVNAQIELEKLLNN
ncbi:MAG: TolC family protein [Bacteroidales bacterium]|nr:TolC family protein [Bacteroidales bacterium]